MKEYITIYTTDKKIITLQNMKKMEEILPTDRFIRVHKSYIIATAKIDSIDKNRIMIHHKSIPIGETYKDRFTSWLNTNNLL